MARDMYLVGVSEEELRPDPKPQDPMSPRQKLENFWYHHKWKVIILGFVAAVATVMVWQLVTRDEPDYRLTLVTEEPLSVPDMRLLKAELELNGLDRDGDGKIEVQIENLYLEGNDQTVLVNAQKLTAEISAGDELFFAFTPAYYQSRIAVHEDEEFHMFAPIEGLPDTIPLIEDGRVWNWKDDMWRLEMADETNLPVELYFGVRAPVGTAGKAGNVEKQAAYMDLLRAFITHTPLQEATAVSEP